MTSSLLCVHRDANYRNSAQIGLDPSFDNYLVLYHPRIHSHSHFTTTTSPQPFAEENEYYILCLSLLRLSLMHRNQRVRLQSQVITSLEITACDGRCVCGIYADTETNDGNMHSLKDVNLYWLYILNCLPNNVSYMN